jgi:hypothetical protein
LDRIGVFLRFFFYELQTLAVTIVSGYSVSEVTLLFEMGECSGTIEADRSGCARSCGLRLWRILVNVAEFAMLGLRHRYDR